MHTSVLTLRIIQNWPEAYFEHAEKGFGFESAVPVICLRVGPGSLPRRYVEPCARELCIGSQEAVYKDVMHGLFNAILLGEQLGVVSVEPCGRASSGRPVPIENAYHRKISIDSLSTPIKHREAVHIRRMTE